MPDPNPLDDSAVNIQDLRLSAEALQARALELQKRLGEVRVPTASGDLMPVSEHEAYVLAVTLSSQAQSIRVREAAQAVIAHADVLQLPSRNLSALALAIEDLRAALELA